MNGRARAAGRAALAALPWLVMAGMLAHVLRKALSTVAGLAWPLFWDACRDLGLAHTILAGRYPEDPCYLGETLWYNPLMGAVIALGGAVSGADLNAVCVALGPWVNLLVPVCFALLAARLANAWVALGALVFLLAGKPELQPIWSSPAYSPWLLAPSTTPFLFYLALLVLLAARKRRKPALYLVTGLAWGVAFTGHTAPAVLFGIVFLLLSAWDHAETWRAGERRGAQIWGAFFLAAGVAFAVSLPYTASILWNYQFRVQNPWPALFADPYLELSRWPDRFRDVVAWHNAVAALGLAAVLRRARARAEARLVLLWFSAALAFLVQHYVWQWFLKRGVLLPGIMPGHHALAYLQAAQCVLFGWGIAASVAFVLRIAFREGAPGTERAPFPAGRPAHALLCLVLCAAAWWRLAPNLETWHAYRFPRDRVAFANAHGETEAAYRWVVRNTAITDVFLCDYAPAVTVVGASGRKLVSSMLFYSNPYIDAQKRLHDTAAMLEALATGDEAAFRGVAAEYGVAYVLAQGKLRDRIDTAAPAAVEPLWRHGETAIYRVVPPPAHQSGT